MQKVLVKLLCISVIFLSVPIVYAVGFSFGGGYDLAPVNGEIDLALFQSNGPDNHFVWPEIYNPIKGLEEEAEKYWQEQYGSPEMLKELRSESKVVLADETIVLEKPDGQVNTAGIEVVSCMQDGSDSSNGGSKGSEDDDGKEQADSSSSDKKEEKKEDSSGASEQQSQDTRIAKRKIIYVDGDVEVVVMLLKDDEDYEPRSNEIYFKRSEWIVIDQAFKWEEVKRKIADFAKTGMVSCIPSFKARRLDAIFLSFIERIHRKVPNDTVKLVKESKDINFYCMSNEQLRVIKAVLELVAQWKDENLALPISEVLIDGSAVFITEVDGKRTEVFKLVGSRTVDATDLAEIKRLFFQCLDELVSIWHYVSCLSLYKGDSELGWNIFGTTTSGVYMALLHVKTEEAAKYYANFFTKNGLPARVVRDQNKRNSPHVIQVCFDVGDIASRAEKVVEIQEKLKRVAAEVRIYFGR